MTQSSPPLVAVAHGSRDPRTAATVTAVLDGLRRARPDLDVRAAYLDHAAPSLPRALSGLDEAVVVPLLLTAAYHTRIDIPAALCAASARQPGSRIGYGRPLGPHPLLVPALERRLREAGVRIGDPDTAVVLACAGSRDQRAVAAVGRLARHWARLRPWWSVTAAHAAAAAPDPASEVLRLARAGAPRIVVAPYLVAPGHFADRIERDCRAAGAHMVANVLGAAPEFVTILLHRYAEALARMGTMARPPALATA